MDGAVPGCAKTSGHLLNSYLRRVSPRGPPAAGGRRVDRTPRPRRRSGRCPSRRTQRRGVRPGTPKTTCSRRRTWPTGAAPPREVIASRPNSLGSSSPSTSRPRPPSAALDPPEYRERPQDILGRAPRAPDEPRFHTADKTPPARVKSRPPSRHSRPREAGAGVLNLSPEILEHCTIASMMQRCTPQGTVGNDATMHVARGTAPTWP
jgi:hypothetical protein